ncbi:MAG: cytidine deaminase [Tissierellia bacterium]|nr:cytidine deaminase [Tissierellia bacterium]
MEIKDLIKLAIDAKKGAYVPYSGFHVGAALETIEGEIFTGCNIEIASYSPTICAERTAIFKGISEGHYGIRRIVIVGDEDYTYPCGVCRQVIREFGPNAQVIVAKDESDYRIYSLDDLLPHSFGPEALHKGDE